MNYDDAYDKTILKKQAILISARYLYLCLGRWLGKTVLPMSIVFAPSLIKIQSRGKNCRIWNTNTLDTYTKNTLLFSISDCMYILTPILPSKCKTKLMNIPLCMLYKNSSGWIHHFLVPTHVKRQDLNFTYRSYCASY